MHPATTERKACGVTGSLKTEICAVLASVAVCSAGCSDSGKAGTTPSPDASPQGSPDATLPGSDLGSGADGSALIDLPTNVSVTLSESSFVFDTPDQKHTFAAIVTGSAPTLRWKSSDTHIATVDGSGGVTSVSGGQAIITATSTVDPGKSASATVSVAEPKFLSADVTIDNTLVTKEYPSLGVTIATGRTFYLRVYPNNTSAATGESIMVANVVVSGVTG